jgi:hypothetical protein
MLYPNQPLIKDDGQPRSKEWGGQIVAKQLVRRSSKTEH